MARMRELRGSPAAHNPGKSQRLRALGPFCHASGLVAGPTITRMAECVSEPSVHSAMAVTVEPATRPEAPVHPFWDRTNMFLFSGVSIFRGLDYASTRNMQARGREEILLPDDVVNNSAGFAGVEAAATATSVGLSYWMHRAGHHKLERWVSIAHISVTGFGAARNYALKSKHPPG